jgi:hypothetical protein
VISVGAIVQANHVSIGLHILNVALIFDTVGVTLVGSFIWFHSLRQRAEYELSFFAQSKDDQAKMQDMFSCCGWFNSTTDPFTQSNFCTQAVAANINTTSCVGPVTAVTDYTLNNIFTSIYAFMAPIAALFLATLCVINMVSPTSCGWRDEHVADARRSAPRRSGSRRLTRSAGAPSSECPRHSRPGPPSA